MSEPTANKLNASPGTFGQDKGDGFGTPVPAAPKEDPGTGEQTNKQAMLFQPTNAGMISGLVGTFNSGGDPFHGNAWGGGYGKQGNPGLQAYTVNGLPIAWPGQYAYFRRALNDPTVRYVRMLAYAPILTTEWKVCSNADAPKGAAKLIEQMFLPLRLDFLNDAVRGDDYGWAGFEPIYELVKGVFSVTRLKPLIHDMTSIYVTSQGDFAGLNNNGVGLGVEKCVIYTHDGESDNYYGRGRLHNVMGVQPWWDEANDAAARYDRKVSGAFIVCHYPPGSSIDKSGATRPNWQIAQMLLSAITASTPIAVCNEFAGEMTNNFLANVSAADRQRWKIEILEDKGSRQPGFKDRLTYLDQLKARAYMVAERSAFESQKGGSKADSETHSDILITSAQNSLAMMTQALNGRRIAPLRYSPVNTVLRINYGDDAVGTVWLEPVALDENKKKICRDVVKLIIGESPKAGEVLSNIQEVFAQAGMPVPTDPPDPDEVSEVFDDMVAMKMPAPVAPGGPGGGAKLSRVPPEVADAMLARIYAAREERVRASLNGHAK